ncbi:hypothetical protein DOTSEDRAFT_25397 [Dothistroma septosporum NZE10]|uniref:Uncharacterized protein n=1 Tax=Dothistroma septosporum (strain NZE10 / CBS 128990) TaxID=675120 RepID=M2YPB0_DOTSN|nr:hypothetical protein DOTSEDRAFT_25397 [Dothistroma septosporum NZE10]
MAASWLDYPFTLRQSTRIGNMFLVLQPSTIGIATSHLLKRDQASDVSAVASSIAASLSSPTFVPYVRPKQKIEDFIAIVDSFTAGTGSNGQGEVLAGDAVRGQRAYPMPMSTDESGWQFVNGGNVALPRFSFHTYTGDTTVQVVTEQLNSGDYKDDKGLPRHLERMRLFRLPDHRWTRLSAELKKLQDEIDSGILRNKINTALRHVASAGRQAGGADPRGSFQCDEIRWGFWPGRKPKLTTALHERLNDLTRSVSGEIKKAADDLEHMCVVYVDISNDKYNDHRFCEPDRTDQKMIDYDAWSWSWDSGIESPSEGPRDPNHAYDGESVNVAQQIYDFVFPDQARNVSEEADNAPAWAAEIDKRYPTMDDLFNAMENSRPALTMKYPLPYFDKAMLPLSK